MSYEQIDFATGLQVLHKQPAENRLYRMDFSNLLEGSLLVAVDSLIAEKQNKVSGSADVIISEVHVHDAWVEFRVTGGTAGEDYKLTALARDGDGNVLEGEGMLYVRDL